MTREEEIKIAASKYMENNSIDGYVQVSDHKDSFIEGAEWSDRNPKSPWIAVEDKLPEIGQAVFIRNSKSNYGVSWIDYDLDWQGEVAYSSLIVTHWMPIPNLPKE